MTVENMPTFDLAKLENFNVLVNKSADVIESNEDSIREDYFSLDEKEANSFATSIIYYGYAVLPPIYHSVFVDPLKNYFTSKYSEIRKYVEMDTTKKHTPFREWLDAINQRKNGHLKEASYAFEEVVNDLFDGWLIMSDRINVRRPDFQTISPLIRWGDDYKDGPYTIAANRSIVENYNIRMSIVSMPASYTKNIALWGATAHECAHDITHADYGLLDEISKLVMYNIKNDEQLKSISVSYNGRKNRFVDRAAEYWKFVMPEAVADVLAILNFGPSSAISLATILIGSERNSSLRNINNASDVHPIDALRLYLASDVIRSIPSLDFDIAKIWADVIEEIIQDKIESKEEFILIHPTPYSDYQTIGFPFNEMRKTVEIVANTIAFTPLKSLEDNSLSDINTWTLDDEIITNDIANDFLDDREPSLSNLGNYYGKVIYPTYLLSAAIIASAKSGNIEDITKCAISVLEKSHARNPVWRGFPIRFRSEMNIHSSLPSLHYSNKLEYP